VLAGVAATPLGAQRYWLETLYPLPYYSSIDGFWLTGYYGRWSPIGFEERPEPVLAQWGLNAGWSTAGSYFAIADLQAPAWWNGWRAGITATAARANRQGYYGLGNATPYFADSVGPARPHLYQVTRSVQSVRLVVQRRVAGGLRVFVAAAYVRTGYRTLSGPSQFERDAAAGMLDTAALPFADLAARAGVVFDSRDHEIDPHQGVFAEALYSAGDGYQRTTGAARIYIRPLEKLTLALRFVGEAVSGTAPLPVQTTIETSETAIESLGGYRSLRAYYDARFAGPGKLLGGIEARYAILWAPTLIELKLVAFYEAGRVFGAGEAWRLTSDGLHPSGGLELAARVQRNNLVTTGFAVGEEGWRFLFASGWSF
jgi:outer membrane protein assembly factor BamA